MAGARQGQRPGAEIGGKRHGANEQREKDRLESEDRKAKLEIRTLRRAEAGSRFHKELEKSGGAVTVGDYLLRKLAAQ